MSVHPSTTRRRGLVLVGIAAGAVLAVAAPLAAAAHVHVDPGEVSAGATETLTFSFSHGCDDSPTTALVIAIPDGVGNATPVIDGAWTITRTAGDDGVPTEVTYTAVEPIESGLKASVSMDVLFDTEAANTSIAFPVVQQCVEGVNEWTEVAAEGEDAESLESPAPVVVVGDAVAEGDGHDHDHGSADEDTADAAESAASADAADAVARWVAGGALAIAVVALVVALVRGRSRTS